MPAKPVVLPSRTFAAQGEATAFFKAMLARYGDGEFLNSDDEDILYELLQRHPEADEKIGAGVQAFYRQRSPDHPTSCFHVLRVDGKKTDFGYPACITGRAPGLRHGFYEACRRSVVPELMHQKQQLFDFSPSGVRCVKTGELTTIHTSEYRHTEPRFRDIVSGFIQAKNLAITPSMVTVSKDMQYQTVFTDPAMAREFIEFHATVAKLEIFKKYVR
ncbi:DCL family protein [Pseudomonas saxonica]|uniref:DCL family protein n=1 Tax=Pseudomonas saxonica TaxID=2600598 RepID=UPI002D76F20D|nr:DCL family protein [Pseudomonas saxonica]WRQ76190.1 DCL family protein [Pseudomonas saxonica]